MFGSGSGSGSELGLGLGDGQHTSASSLAHTDCVFADREVNVGERADRVLYFISPFTLSQRPNP